MPDLVAVRRAGIGAITDSCVTWHSRPDPGKLLRLVTDLLGARDTQVVRTATLPR